MTTLIQLDNVAKHYGANAVLRGVSLSIAEGEFVSIMGASGSGTSTLLNIIGALDTQYTGDARVAGRDLRVLDDRAVSTFRNTSIGFVFQAFHLLPHLTCGQNVALPAYFVSGRRGLGESQNRKAAGEAEIEQQVIRCLGRVGLLHKKDEFPLHLSGGERQRIAIARALFNQPKILLCDEPSGALVSKTGAQIMGLFQRLNRETGVTLIVVTHAPEVSALADRIIQVVDGQILAGGASTASSSSTVTSSGAGTPA